MYEDDDEYDPFSFDETFMFEERTYHNINQTFWKDFALYILQDGGKGLFLSPWIGRAIKI